MISAKEKIDVGPTKIFNREMIYARAMYLLGSNRTTPEKILKYELSPIPHCS